MSLGQKILQEITARGALPFARFMELALNCPDSGFYEKEPDTVGRSGDFYTSVSVGRLFGELLAFDFAGKLTQLETRNPELGTQIIEAGAHDGKLARDILSWLQPRRPELYERLEYVILEPSARRRSWQQATLGAHSDKVRWLEALPTRHSALGTRHFHGVIFANELLDALPVHRLGWDARSSQWFEWGVQMADEKFFWSRMSLTADVASEFSRLLGCPTAVLDVLPDGFTTEICPAATVWWTQAAQTLGRGYLVTLDYGLTGEEFFQPHRRDGTLRSYHRHQLVTDVLAQPGEQDITAHVNFSAIQSAGEAAGLRTEFFGPQSQFLTAIAGEAWKHDGGFGEWQSTQTRQFQTLTHPDFLGRAFRVLVQSRAGR